MTDTTTFDYYRSPSGNIQAIDIILEYEMDFTLGNVLKYIVRAGKKDGANEIEDLEKAKSYLEYRINHVRKKGNRP